MSTLWTDSNHKTTEDTGDKTRFIEQVSMLTKDYIPEFKLQVQQKPEYVFDKWVDDFNNVRPHEALEMKTPSECYVKSNIKYSSEHIEIKYPKGFKNRYVNDRGYFILKSI